ncbi:MAG: PaaI family thioesterase [Anaerovoracaceae bacterium]
MANSFLLTDKEAVMQNLKNINSENTGEHHDRVNGLMAATYVDCDIESLTVTAEFQVLPWELNRKDILHGGVICTMLDHIAAITVTSFSNLWCPTVDMDVRFISAGQLDDTIIATGRIVSAGKRVFHTEAVLKSKTTGKIIATSTSTFLNILKKEQPAI